MTAPRRARTLIVIALACILGLAAWQGRTVWEDSGKFAFLLFGVPAACTVLALAIERISGTMLAPLLVGALGIVSLAWSLITGLGVGLLFVVPSLLLLVAAVVVRVDRRRQTTVSQQH